METLWRAAGRLTQQLQRHLLPRFFDDMFNPFNFESYSVDNA